MSWNRCECKRLTRYPGGLKCMRCQRRDARARDPEYYKLLCSVYYYANREERLAKQKAWKLANSHHVSLKNAIYNYENREKHIEYQRELRRKKRD